MADIFTRDKKGRFVKGTRVMHETKHISKSCLVCGKKFSVPPSLDRINYCSRLCSNIAKKGKPSPNKGKKASLETRKKQSLAKLETWKNEEYRSHMLSVHKGTNLKEENPNWRGGISFEPYGIAFNKELKERIRKRDNYRCQECFRHQDELYTETGKKYRLHIHHIDYDKKNNGEDNLISLCRNCHLQTNYKRNDWTKYYRERMGRSVSPN